MGLNLLLIVICLLVLMATGTWLSITLFGTGILALTFLGKGGMAYVLESVLFNSVASYSLVAIPLFVLMGEILIESGCSKQIFRGVKKLLRPFPGGMLHANIVACSIFAAPSATQFCRIASSFTASSGQKQRPSPCATHTPSVEPSMP